MAVQSVRANGIELAYESLGEGPPVVFVGGLDMDMGMWRNGYAPAFLERRYRALLLNLRGVPPSQVTPPPYSVFELADDCEAAIRALGIESCFVVGASLGSFVSQEWALRHPRGKLALALIGTVGRQSQWFRMLTRGELELYEKPMSRPSDYMVANDLLQLYTVEELLDDARMERAAAALRAKDYTAPGRRGLYQAAARYDDRLAALAGIQAPAIVVGFAQDVMTPAPLAREVAERIPGGRFMQIDDAAHYGIFSKRMLLRSAVVEFFEQHRPVS
jgi:pimeloyl-ACP methyl ester carboxylesterase